jgi:hypothetical protein
VGGGFRAVGERGGENHAHGIPLSGTVDPRVEPQERNAPLRHLVSQWGGARTEQHPLQPPAFSGGIRSSKVRLAASTASLVHSAARDRIAPDGFG